MNSIQFPGWDAAIEDAELPHRLKNSFRITIGWYLSFCRRARVGITHESARSFIAWAQGEKQPQDWQLEQWKEGIRWFFRSAKAAAASAAMQDSDTFIPEEAGNGGAESAGRIGEVFREGAENGARGGCAPPGRTAGEHTRLACWWRRLAVHVRSQRPPTISMKARVLERRMFSAGDGGSVARWGETPSSPLSVRSTGERSELLSVIPHSAFRIREMLTAFTPLPPGDGNQGSTESRPTGGP